MVFVVAPRLPGILESEVSLFTLLICFLGLQVDRIALTHPKVGVSAVSRSTDVCRYRFDLPALTPGSIDSIGLVWGVPGWLHCAGALLVSRFIFRRLADLIAVYSLDLESSASPSTPDESVQTPF